jgi:hypothetical protein
MTLVWLLVAVKWSRVEPDELTMGAEAAQCLLE